MTVFKHIFVALIVLWSITIAVQALAATGSELPLTPGESCMSAACHSDLGKKKYVHLVAGDGSTCILCHQAPDPARHRFKLTAEGGALCASCHGVMTDKEYKHLPVSAGLCTVCHDPHQADYPKQLRFPSTAELCFSCHDKNKFEGAVAHGPVAGGQCLKCHDPHTSEYPGLTRAAEPDLCFSCHDRDLKAADGKRLPSSQRNFDNTKLTHHLPFGAGLCQACHYPHSSPNYRLLKSPYPESFYASYSKDKYICFTCHDEKAFREPRTLTATAFRNGNLNLHYRHVNRKKGRTCRACHHHHGAENPRLIRKTVPFGNRYITIDDFELTETGGKCASTCHTVMRYDRVEAVRNTLKVTPRQGDDVSTGASPGTRQEQLKK